jgi:hypothetical protein
MKIKIPIAKVMPTGAFTIMSFGNKTYVCPPWIEVPNGTKMSDIKIIRPKPVAPALKSIHAVKGSTGSSYTIVIDSRNGNSCTCVGFQYRRSCKHLTQILNQK